MTLLLLNTTIKTSLIVAVALVAITAMRRQSAAARHFILCAALICAAATPALRFVAPAWQAASGTWLSGPRAELIDRPLAVLDDVTPAQSGSVATRATARFSATAVVRSLGVIWMAGAAASLFLLIVGLVRLEWIASRAIRLTAGPWVDAAGEIARTYGLRQRPVLLRSDHPSLLGTWGIWRARVLLPADAPNWAADRVQIVLGHELAHVRRRDWTVQLAAEALRSVYWFNPLMWLACRRLRIESEQACDDAVLKLGVEGEVYATELVGLARTFRSARPVLVPAAAIARPSSLERRVRAMLNVHLDRNPITRTASFVAAVALGVVTVFVAGFGASAQSSFATVSGSIVDPKSRPLVGVTLTLSNPQSQTKYEIKSDAAGHFEFVGVPPGTYTLLYEYIGFASLKREGIVLAGQTFQSNAVLQVGSLQETITITDADVPRQPQAPAVTTAQRRAWAPKPDACANGPSGGCIVPPTKTKDVRPIYPIGVKPGDVQLAAVIGTDGRVASVDVVGDGGGFAADLSLAQAAATAVSQWEFTPTYLDGEPIDVRMKVDVHFVSGK